MDSTQHDLGPGSGAPGTIKEEEIEANVNIMLDDYENEIMGEALPKAGIEGRQMMPLQHDKGALSYAGGPIGQYLHNVDDLVKRCGGEDKHKLYYAS